MVRHGQGGLAAVNVVPHHRNVLRFAHDSKSQALKCSNDLASERQPGTSALDLDTGLRNESVEHRRFNLKDFISKALNVKLNR